MHNRLQNYFPMIREREELLAYIRERKELKEKYENWSEEHQKEFLDSCTGVKGLKLLYDSFFKEVMNPEYAPERLNEFLSLLLGQSVKILQVLPNDNTRIADESALLITDLVVQLEDGSIANLEIQKLGYRFSGERSACYSADLLLRQYKRVRGEMNKKFSYKNIKNVYTIVLFEESPEKFKQYEQQYIHRFQQQSDSGLELNLLQKYVYIPLDIFNKIRKNRGIKGKLEAWFTFLSTDEPETIIQLIEEYPMFRQMYGEVYELCRNVERVMGLFSEELRILDRNTVQLMIDEMQEELNEKSKLIEEQKAELARLQRENEELKKQK